MSTTPPRHMFDEFEIWWDSLPAAPDFSFTEIFNMKQAAFYAWKEAVERARDNQLIF